MHGVESQKSVAVSCLRSTLVSTYGIIGNGLKQTWMKDEKHP